MKRIILFVSACVLAIATSSSAQSTQHSDTFTWHGELVALDEGSRVITIKSRVVGDAALAAFGRLKAGDRVSLMWSGFDNFADAIYGVSPTGEAKKTEDRFNFGVEFVSFDAKQQYATFKVQVPQGVVTGLKSVKPGEWITATSPHGAASKSTPVTAARPYVTSPTTSK